MKLVVIVDDNESVATSLAIAIANIPGVTTTITHHPSGALRLFEDEENGRTISAIVTDFNLPHFNGLELIRQVREIEKYRSLPAILITAEENLAAANGCILNTPNAIFRKPFSVREVCRVLEKLLA